jgi:hypothetical protein
MIMLFSLIILLFIRAETLQYYIARDSIFNSEAEFRLVKYVFLRL